MAARSTTKATKNKNIASSLEEQIKNYGSQIQVLQDDVDKLRKTPDVYIGDLGNEGFLTLIREVFQNALDEIMKGVAVDSIITLIFDERTNKVTVIDHGRGIPHGMIGTIFGSTHTSSNYTKEKGVYSSGKNGCGGSAANILSHSMTINSFVLGKGKHAEFIEGHLWDKGEVDIPAKECEGKQGSVVSFIPSETCLNVDKFSLTWRDVYDLIASMVPLSPIGTVCLFDGIDKNGVVHHEDIVNQDGLITHLINMTQNPFITPVVAHNDIGTMKVDLCFTYDTSAENNFEDYRSFNNTCPNESGKHLDGAIDGIGRFFKEYMNKIYLANVKSKAKLICGINDIKQGLKLVVSTYHLYPIYDSQKKKVLTNDDIFPFVSQTVYEALQEWSQSNTTDLQSICKYFRTVIELRMKQDKDKVKLANSFKSSILSGYPDKFKKPNLKKGFELIIVEGDSAFGSAENSRDNLTQGIYPVRGKLPNAFDKPMNEIFKNEEVASIFQIVGGGYGKNFDLSKVNVSKVIFMADADPDGKHILTLLLRLFAMYARPLVEAGMVYAAIPPLFGIPIGKDKYKYFTDKADYVQYVQKKFSTENVLTDSIGKTLTTAKITNILINTDNYVSVLESTAANYAIDPFLLECILINKDNTAKKFKAAIEKQFRFMQVRTENGITVLDGLAGNKAHTVYLTQHLIDECRIVSRYLNANDPYYTLNGQVVSLYGLRLAFAKYEPPHLLRFKGLGEMNPKMLGVSTLRPDGERLLVRYTYDDINKEINEMRKINSSKDVLLKGLNVKRQDIY